MSHFYIAFSDDVYAHVDVPDEYAIKLLNCLEDNLYDYIYSDPDDSAGYFMMCLHQFKNMIKSAGTFDFLPGKSVNDIKTDIALDYPKSE